MRPPYATVVLIAVLAGGCAGTAARPASPPADSAPQPAATTLTIENILQWPLEGEEGFKRLRLRLVGDLAVTQDSSTHWRRQESAFLSDGYALSFVTIRKFSGQIDIGIETDRASRPSMHKNWSKPKNPHPAMIFTAGVLELPTGRKKTDSLSSSDQILSRFIVSMQ